MKKIFKKILRIFISFILVISMFCTYPINMIVQSVKATENNYIYDDLENVEHDHNHDEEENLDESLTQSFLDYDDLNYDLSNDYYDENEYYSDKYEPVITTPSIDKSNNVNNEIEIVNGTGIVGDVNADGFASNMDVVLLYRYISNIDVKVDYEALDINGDGVINHQDVINLFNYISGWSNITTGYGFGWNLECVHDIEHIAAVTATCNYDGSIEHWHCHKCNRYFADETLQTVITKMDIIVSKYTKHIFNEWQNISDATCSSKGLKTHMCAKCGYEETVETEMLEHNIESYDTYVNATCTENGIEIGFCEICENEIEREIPALGHQAGDPVDSNEMCLDRNVGTISCTICNEVLSSYGHNYVTTIIDETCTTDGQIIKECSRCQDKEITVVEYTGHIEGFLTTTKEATCTEIGEMAINCVYCEYIFTDSTVEIPALNHQYTITVLDDYYLLSCNNCSHNYFENKDNIEVHKITLINPNTNEAEDIYVQESNTTLLPIPSKEGYSFGGWYVDEAMEEPFDGNTINEDITLYVKWEQLEVIESSDNVLTNMDDDFSFIIKMNEDTKPLDFDNVVLVIDEDNNIISIQAIDLGEGLYKIVPNETYEKGELYKVTLKENVEFAEYENNELWFSVEKDNSTSLEVKPGVIKIDNADIFAITLGDDDSVYLMLYDDVLDVNNYFVIYEGKEDNITSSGKVYDEGTFDKYYLYRIDELTEDEFSEVFVNIDIYFDGEAGLGEFIPDEEFENEVEQAFMQSALYAQINLAAETFAHLSSDGKYYYDHDKPKIDKSINRDGNKITILFTVEVVFQRLDTETRKVVDLYTITFKIKNETVFTVSASAKNINNFKIALTPVNTMSIGIYAKTGKKINNDKKLEYFKEIFNKTKESGEIKALDSATASQKKNTILGSLTLNVSSGISVKVSLYNVFAFDAVGEIGFESTTVMKPSVGIAREHGNFRIIKDFEYKTSMRIYSYAKIDASNRLGVSAQLSLFGFAHASAGIEVGPYLELGGMFEANLEFGNKVNTKYSAAIDGYIEAGINTKAYIEVKLTTLIFKIEVYKKRWDILDNKYVIFSFGSKEMPVKFAESDAPIIKNADLAYEINIMDSISTEIVIQNIKTMTTTNKTLNLNQVVLTIIDKPDYVSFNFKKNLIISKNAGNISYVDLKIKVSYKSLHKFVQVRINIAHDYLDEFTCHERTCQYCGYISKATTSHRYSEWVEVTNGLCTPNPYSMRICFDCRYSEFSGIDPNAPQHHDYQIIPELSVEPTCMEDGYLTYQCVRENCQSETKIAIIKRFGSHDYIWLDNGETHYQHCQRVGCGYNTKESGHISRRKANCLNAEVCIYCNHVMNEALGHDYQTITTKNPTCTEVGYYNYLECSRCYDKQGYTERPAINHEYTLEWKWQGFSTVIVVATCKNGHIETHTIRTESSIIKKATCTTTGEKQYIARIIIDGKLYTQTQIETLTALGHNIITRPAKEPTCTADGWYAYDVCTRCLENNKVTRPKLSHRGGAATCASQATCELCHQKYGKTLPHNFGTEYYGNEAGHYHACICGAKDKVEKHIKDKASPTETEPVKCIICDYVITPAVGHINHNYTILCYDEYSHWYKCDGCNKIRQYSSHSGLLSNSCLEQPTCSVCNQVFGTYGPHKNQMYTNDEMHWEVCQVCYKVTNKEYHHGGYKTCTSLAECSDCNTTYGEYANHYYSSKWTANSKTHYHECSCGKQSDVAAHIPNRNNPTETKPVKCTICDYVITPATGHIKHNYIILQSDENYHWYKCSGCSEIINKTLHNSGHATCDQRAICAVCNSYYGETPDHIYYQTGDEYGHWMACTMCDYHGMTIVHSGGSSTCITKAVCQICSLEYGTYDEHEYIYICNDIEHYGQCTICKETTNPSVHTGGIANCQNQAICSICNTSYGTLGSHISNEDDHNCETPVVCMICKKILENPKTHSYDNDCDVNCNNEGCNYTRVINHQPNSDDGDCTTAITCSVCGTILKTAKIHSFNNACDPECNNSGCYFTREITHKPNEDDADCTTAITCSICNIILTYAKNEHIGGISTCTNFAKCTICGMEYGTLKEHTPEPDDNDCSTPITCTECNTILIEGINHDFVNSTNYQNNDTSHWKICAHANCNITNQTSGSEEHSYGDWYIPTHDKSIHAKECVCGKLVWSAHTPEPDDNDCTTNIYCTVCNLVAIKGQTNHDFDGDYLNDETGHWLVCANENCNQISVVYSHAYGDFEEDENNSSMHKHTCNICRYTESFAHNFEEGTYVSNATSHWKKCKDCDAEDNWNVEAHAGTQATCTQKSVCTKCNREYGSVDPNNHDYTLSYNNEIHYDECSRCNKIINRRFHTIDYRVDVTQLGNTVNYTHAYTEYCTVCEYSKVLSTENIHQHERTEAYGDVAATCETSGYQAGLRCLECGHIYNTPTLIPAKGHAILEDGWVDPVDPTCTQQGTIGHEVCMWCSCALNSSGNKITDISIPKLNHILEKEQTGQLIEIDVTQLYQLQQYPEFAAGCIGTPPSDEIEGTSSFTCNTCNETVFVRVIGHYYEYIYDSTHHWGECIVQGCDEQTNKEEHQMEERKCTICDYNRSYSVGLSYVLTSDKTGFLVSGIGLCTDTNIVIPQTIGGKPVVGIGSHAFYNCSSLISIEIPNSVTSIGDYAFYNCSSLTSITVSNNITSIGMGAFYGCYKLFEVYNLSSLSITTGSSSNGYIGYNAKVIHTSLNEESHIKETKDGYIYGYDNNNNYYLLGYKGNDINLVLPELLDGNSYSIYNYAFSGCSNLTSITIPEGVTSIGNGAFYECYKLFEIYNLSSLSITKGSYDNGRIGYYAKVIHTSLDEESHIKKTEDGYIYGYDNNINYYLIGYIGNDTELTLPENLDGNSYSINNYAFYNCTSLTSVVIPEGITSIGRNTFYNCTSLTSVEIPEGVTSIGESTFYNCRSLTNIDILNSVTSIGSNSFYGCSSLINIVIPNSVTSIGSNSFYGCSSLTNVIFEENSQLTSIGSSAFANCSSLTSIAIPNRVTSIGSGAFAYCNSLTNVIFEENSQLTSIGSSAFANCSSLTSIAIPNRVTSIGSGAFAYCNSLTSITIPEGVTSIGSRAFENCSSLTSVEIPNSVISIGYDAFYNCSSLTSITIPEGVTSIGSSAFYNCSSLISIEIPNSVTSIGDSAFSGCSSLISIEIPNSVTSIGDAAFSYCSSLLSIEIPNSVTSIGYAAFDGCYKLFEVCNLSSLNITIGSEDNGYVGYYAKVIHTSLDEESHIKETEDGYIYVYDNNNNYYLIGYNGNDTELTLPENLDGNNYVINDYAFRGCSSLTSITIPEGVTSIGNGAFYECYKLFEIYNLSSLSITKGSYDNGRIGYYAKVIHTSLDEESHIKETSDGYIYGYDNNINYYLIGYIGNDTELTLPENLDGNSYSINNYAFYNCTSLTSITIPEGVTSIVDYAFFGCTRLTSITIPEGVTSIGRSAFEYCTSLTSITIPEGVTSIGHWAFSHCTRLTSITIPEGVTSIGMHAFFYCTSLTSITIPEGVTSIEWGAFSQCTSLTSITIPAGVTSIGDSAFSSATTVLCASNMLPSGWNNLNCSIIFEYKEA